MRNHTGISVVIILVVLLTSLVGSVSAAPLSQATGQVCVQAFDDINGNGTREADEKLLAGVGFTLSDDSGVKASYSTDGVSEPYCFGKLAGGSYTVRAKAPAGYESTTEGQWAISLASGAQFDAKYGANKPGSAPAGSPGSANTGSPSTATTAAGGSPSIFGRVVLGALGVIILLVAGFMAGMFVQRSRAK